VRGGLIDQIDRLVREAVGHFAVDDALSEPLDQGDLALLGALGQVDRVLLELLWVSSAFLSVIGLPCTCSIVFSTVAKFAPLASMRSASESFFSSSVASTKIWEAMY